MINVRSVIQRSAGQDRHHRSRPLARVGSDGRAARRFSDHAEAVEWAETFATTSGWPVLDRTLQDPG